MKEIIPDGQYRHAEPLPEKLLFLDLDGVINSLEFMDRHSRFDEGNLMKTMKQAPESMIDPAALKRLQYVCNETGLKIVITSTWRYFYPEEHFIRMFAAHGWENAPIIGVTRDLRCIGVKRGHEIKLWVHENRYMGHYYCLDDMDLEEFLPDQTLLPTEFETGLLDEHVPMMIDGVKNGFCEKLDGTQCHCQD